MVLALKGIPSFPGPVGTALMRPLHGKHSTPLDAIIQAVFNAWKTSYNVDVTCLCADSPPYFMSLTAKRRAGQGTFIPSPTSTGRGQGCSFETNCARNPHAQNLHVLNWSQARPSTGAYSMPNVWWKWLKPLKERILFSVPLFYSPL